jgi:hypothetical protein
VSVVAGLEGDLGLGLALGRHGPRLDAGLRDTFAAACQDGGICPDKRDRLMERVAALLERAQTYGRVRPDVMIDDVQALMCGLSASIGAGGDWHRLASVMLAGLRAPEQATTTHEHSTTH